MDILVEFLLALSLYFITVVAAYYVTEVKRLPKWLQFPPFHCRKCLTFWSNITVGIIIGISFGLYITLFSIIILAILTAIAMYVDEKNKTIKL